MTLLVLLILAWPAAIFPPVGSALAARPAAKTGEMRTRVEANARIDAILVVCAG